jgi:hypothetical protein
VCDSVVISLIQIKRAGSLISAVKRQGGDIWGDKKYRDIQYIIKKKIRKK